MMLLRLDLYSVRPAWMIETTQLADAEAYLGNEQETLGQQDQEVAE